MVIYYIVIILSCFFVFLGSKIKNRFARLLFNVAAVLIPSLIAGYRDTSVGMDLAYYAIPCFDSMCYTHDIKLAMLYVGESGLEPLYVLYNYLITRFTNDIFWALYLQQIFVLGIVLLLCYKLKEHISVYVVYSVFMLLCYTESMSANRQYFALGLALFSFYYVVTKKIIPFLITITFAILFHYSAVMVLPVYWVYNYGSKYGIRKIHLYFVAILGLICFICFPIIIRALIDIGLMATKYERYLDDTFKVHSINIVILFCLFFLLSLFGKKTIQVNLVKLLLILVFFMYMCGVYNDVATRVAWYYLLFAALLMVKIFKQQKNRVLPINIVLILFSIQFIYLSIVTTFADAIPYTSKELKISK